MKNLKPIPKFKNENEEREFWATHSSVDYVDWSKAKRVSFPNLKPSDKTISLRVSSSLLDRIKLEANKMSVPYQSLMKIKLHEIFNEPMGEVKVV
ncbi:MAG: BrnA antitoxin family protein [Patescibacteria group bacterium]